MANWASLGNETDVFMASYLSKTASPAFRSNTSSKELAFSPSPTKYAASLTKMEDDAFCTQENLDQCISYMNQELTVIGYPSLYNSHTNAHAFDITSLVNTCYDLYKKHQKHTQLREDLENLQHKTATDLSQQQQRYSRLKAAYEQGERESIQSQERERQLKEKKKLVDTKLKAEKDEVKRLQLILKRTESHHHHDTKKKEKELQRLKEKIGDLLKDRKDRKTGMDVLNHVPKSDGRRPTWASPMIKDRKEVDTLQMIIRSFEGKQKELMVENSDLRESLKHLQGKVVQLVSEPTSPAHSQKSQVRSPESLADDTDNEESSVFTNISDDLSEGHFQMPFDAMKPNLERNFGEMFKSLQHHSKKENKTNSDGSSPSPSKKQQDKEIAKLNSMVSRLWEIIEQQEKYMQERALQQDGSEISILDDSELAEEQERLQTEKEMFLQQKANFDQERKLFTEAAIRLGREKKQFEMEKAVILEQQFLQLTPFKSPDTSRKEGKSEARFTKSRPIFSPAPKRISTPSTVELYRKIGLSNLLHDKSPNLSVSKVRQNGLDSTKVSSQQHSSKFSKENNSCRVTPVQISVTSPPNSRIMEHLEGIKTVLFNKNKTPDHDNKPA